MTDKQKFDERVQECGYRMEYVAERLGITVQPFNPVPLVQGELDRPERRKESFVFAL